MWQHLQRDSFLQVNELARDTPMLHEPLTLFAQYGVLLFAGIVVLAWWQARQDPRPATMAAALWTPVAALLAIGLNQPLGRLVQEARPFTVLPHALVLVEHSHDFSFPSDHAVMAGAVTAGVLLGHRRLGWFTAAAAVLMAFTRVYVGAHFPLDVVAGLLLGAAVTLGGYLALRPLVLRVVTALSRTPVRPLLTSSRASTRSGDPSVEGGAVR
jgi:undecaprenyl-diphosphatase